MWGPFQNVRLDSSKQTISSCLLCPLFWEFPNPGALPLKKNYFVFPGMVAHRYSPCWGSGPQIRFCVQTQRYAGEKKNCFKIIKINKEINLLCISRFLSCKMATQCFEIKRINFLLVLCISLTSSTSGHFFHAFPCAVGTFICNLSAYFASSSLLGSYPTHQNLRRNS